METDINIDTLYFSTYTNLWWKPILENPIYKNVVMDSLEFLVINNRIKLYCYVIMPNHIHLVWLIREEHILKNVQRDFLKFTAQHIKFKMIETNDPLLRELWVDSKDRKFQIWERNGFSFQLRNPKTIIQKLNYIHLNPVRKNLCERPWDYEYSSAKFYETDNDPMGILSHISEVLEIIR